MSAGLDNPTEYQKIFHWAETQKDGTIPSFGTRKNDPYEVSLLSYAAMRAQSRRETETGQLNGEFADKSV
jgi:hypothetical protein